MERLTKWAFNNKAPVILIVVLAMTVGIWSYFKLPLEYLPNANAPQISITALGQGNDAGSMASDVTDPIEKAVAGIKGKTEMVSTTGDGFAQVNLSFKAGTNLKEAKTEIQDALGDVPFPEGVSKPFVAQLNTSMIPIAYVSLALKDGATKQQQELLESKIVPALKGLEGVSGASFSGKSESQVFLKLDMQKLAQLKVPVQAVAGALQGQNMAAVVGSKAMDGQETTIKTVGSVNDLDALNKIAIVPGVQLMDVAKAEVKANTGNITRINGKDAYLVFIQKEAGYNVVKLGKAVQTKVEDLNKEYSFLDASVFWANSDMVQNSVDSMTKEVGMGALFATIVILLFLRNLRTTLITVVSIPLSLGLTLFLLYQSGISLNILTLGGVAVAVGRLVDDSIVVIENIFRKAQQGRTFDRSMIVEAVKEVGGAITSSTLTTIAVFMPMGIVQGSLHDFLMPFALTVTYSLLASLLVALIVVPLMGMGLLKKATLPKHKEPKRYLSMLNWSLNHKWVPLFVAVGLFAGSIFLYTKMPQGVINASDSSMVQMSFKLPVGTPADQVKAKGIELEKFALDQSETKSVMMTAGNSSEGAKYGDVSEPTLVSYNVTMKEKANAQHFVDQIKTKKSQYPGAELNVGAVSMMGSGSSVMTLDLVGTNVDDLIAASSTVTAAMKDVEGVEKISSNQQETKPVYTIAVDPAKANAQEVATQLHNVLNNTPIGMMKLDGNNTAIVVEALVNPSKGEDLSNMHFETKTGEMVPLSQIAKLTKTNQPGTVYHKEGNQYLRLSLQVNPDKVKETTDKVTLKQKELKLPEGVKLQTGGVSDTQKSDMTNMVMTMLASIGVVYLIMVLTFKTLRAPLAILFSLPLAAIGAILGLVVTGVTFDITSMIGGLMLIGIVVTNAIVLLERVKHNEETMTIRESLLEAGSVRLRPIMMTAVATICAMLPLVFKAAEMGSIVSKSLAIVVIGGLAVSTMLTLVIVPVMYELLHFRKAKKQRKATATAAETAEAAA